MDEHDLIKELHRIADRLNDAMLVLARHDRAMRGPNSMEVTEWNQTPNGRVINMISEAI